jgi:ubiquinone/menaquinone biosynthesis C-methylase UbiE
MTKTKEVLLPKIKRWTVRETLLVENFHGNEIPSSLELGEEYLRLICPDSLVADAGCGFGRISNFLADSKRALVMGFDINCSGIKYAKENCPSWRTNFYVMDATQTEFGRNTFDHWVGVGLLGSVEKDVRVDALKEAFRVLKPGGTIAIAEFKMNLDDSEQREKYKRDKDETGEWGSRIVRNKKGDKVLLIGKHFTKEELIQLLTDAGFVSIQPVETPIESAGIGDGQMKVRTQHTVWGFKPSSKRKRE